MATVKGKLVNIISDNYSIPSADATGAFWCYVDSSHYSSCEDLQPSSRFPSNPWSYQACSTPDQSSYQCQQFGISGSGSASSGGGTVCKDKRCLSAGVGGAGYGGTDAPVSVSTGEGVSGGGTGTCQCPQCPSVTTLYPPIINPRDPAGNTLHYII